MTFQVKKKVATDSVLLQKEIGFVPSSTAFLISAQACGGCGKYQIYP